MMAEKQNNKPPVIMKRQTRLALMSVTYFTFLLDYVAINLKLLPVECMEGYWAVAPMCKVKLRHRIGRDKLVSMLKARIFRGKITGKETELHLH